MVAAGPERLLRSLFAASSSGLGLWFIRCKLNNALYSPGNHPGSSPPCRTPTTGTVPSSMPRHSADQRAAGPALQSTGRAGSGRARATSEAGSRASCAVKSRASPSHSTGAVCSQGGRGGGVQHGPPAGGLALQQHRAALLQCGQAGHAHVDLLEGRDSTGHHGSRSRRGLHGSPPARAAGKGAAAASGVRPPAHRAPRAAPPPGGPGWHRRPAWTPQGSGAAGRPCPPATPAAVRRSGSWGIQRCECGHGVGAELLEPPLRQVHGGVPVPVDRRVQRVHTRSVGQRGDPREQGPYAGQNCRQRAGQGGLDAQAAGGGVGVVQQLLGQVAGEEVGPAARALGRPGSVPARPAGGRAGLGAPRGRTQLRSTGSISGSSVSGRPAPTQGGRRGRARVDLGEPAQPELPRVVSAELGDGTGGAGREPGQHQDLWQQGGG